jgi:hypothetical protein
MMSASRSSGQYRFLNLDRTIVLREDTLIAWNPFENHPVNAAENTRWIDAGSPTPEMYSMTPAAPWTPPLPLIPPLSRRQFFTVLAFYHLITEEQALAAVQHGTVPPQFEKLLEGLPEDQQFNARMLLSGAGEFQRDHPLIASSALILGISNEQIDEMWRRGRSL